MTAAAVAAGERVLLQGCLSELVPLLGLGRGRGCVLDTASIPFIQVAVVCTGARCRQARAGMQAALLVRLCRSVLSCATQHAQPCSWEQPFCPESRDTKVIYMRKGLCTSANTCTCTHVQARAPTHRSMHTCTYLPVYKRSTPAPLGRFSWMVPWRSRSANARAQVTPNRRVSTCAAAACGQRALSEELRDPAGCSAWEHAVFTGQSAHA